MNKEIITGILKETFPNGALAVNLGGDVSRVGVSTQVSMVDNFRWVEKDGSAEVFVAIDGARYKDIRFPIVELVEYKDGYLTDLESGYPQFYLIPLDPEDD